MPRYPLYEMIGKRFGRWLVLERTENGPGGTLKYICRCDCGRIRTVGSFDLRSGHTTQCRWCAARSRPPGHGKSVLGLLHNAKARSKKSGLPCTITLADIKIPERCPLLDIPIITTSSCVTDNSPSLDRIIPELGYIPNNIIVISFKANTIKQRATPDELRMIADRLEIIMKERDL